MPASDGNTPGKDADPATELATPAVTNGSALALESKDTSKDALIDAAKPHKWSFEKFDYIPSVTLAIKTVRFSRFAKIERTGCAISGAAKPAVAT